MKKTVNRDEGAYQLSHMGHSPVGGPPAGSTQGVRLGTQSSHHPRWSEKLHIIRPQMTSHQHHMAPLRKTAGTTVNTVRYKILTYWSL